jgi:hypothetical protein
MKVLFPLIALLLFVTACNNDNKSTELLAELDVKMQNANYREFSIGLDDVCRFEEIEKTNSSCFSTDMSRLRQVLFKIDSIEYFTEKAISELDYLKLKILKDAGEDIIYKKNHKNQILIESFKEIEKFGCRPIPLNSNLIQSKTSEIDFELFIDKNGNPTKLAKRIWKILHLTRKKIIENMGNFHTINYFDYNEKRIYFNATKNFNFFSNQNNEIQKKKFEKYINNSKSVFSDDAISLIEVFNQMSFDENYSNCKNWFEANFKGLSVIEAMLKLSKIENDILVARSKALENWSYRFHYSGYVFNTPISYSNGPSNIQLGDSIQIKVTYGLYSNENNKVITVNDRKAIINYKNGIGFVNVIPNHKGTITYSGDAIWYNFRGETRKKPWSWTVNVN